MKRLMLSALSLALVGCSSAPLERAELDYKVFPQIANFKYEYKLAIPKPSDARETKFILNNDDFFKDDIATSIGNIMFKEIRATNSFTDISQVENEIDFNPTSTQIQDIRRTNGKDAILLVQINKFNANIRKLSDQDTSNFVNLKVFTNITYKLILTDSETVVFLVTKDSSEDKVINLDKKLYTVVNELALKTIRDNITEARDAFILIAKDAMLKQMKKENKIVAEAPAEVTEAPAEVAEAPAEVAETPAEVAETPAEVAETPAEVAETPAEVAETPAEVAEAPATNETETINPDMKEGK